MAFGKMAQRHRRYTIGGKQVAESTYIQVIPLTDEPTTMVCQQCNKLIQWTDEKWENVCDCTPTEGE